MRCNPNLAEAAEKWGRQLGLTIPPRNSAAWKGLYTAWQRSLIRNNPGPVIKRIDVFHKFPVCLIFTGTTDKGNLSYKLWAIKVTKNKIQVAWGKANATKLCSITKTFKNHAAAQLAADRLCLQKLNKGYRPLR